MAKYDQLSLQCNSLLIIIHQSLKILNKSLNFLTSHVPVICQQTDLGLCFRFYVSEVYLCFDMFTLSNRSSIRRHARSSF